MFLFDVEIDRLIKEKKFFLFFLIEMRGLLDMKIVFLNQVLCELQQRYRGVLIDVDDDDDDGSNL